MDAALQAFFAFIEFKMFQHVDWQNQVIAAVEVRKYRECVSNVDRVINKIVKRRQVVGMNFDAVDSGPPLVVVFVVLPKFEQLARKNAIFPETNANVQSR